MVSPQNMKDIMAPTKRPMSTFGFIRVTWK